MLNALKKNYKIASIIFIVFLVSFVLMRVYVVTELEGDFNKHILPGEMFGVPEKLKEKGLESLYKLPGHTGWDGQFYYYISNDIFGLTDVPLHCDSNAYRYQRIGLPLLANILSKITFQEYVSPFIFYMTSLLIVLLATGLFAKFLQNKGLSPFLSLFWSLGIGVQLTMMNGLPDAAADGLLIIAILMWMNKRYWLFSFFAISAALSREAYILLPFVLFLYSIYNMYKNNELYSKKILTQNLIYIIPGMIFLSWHIYIRQHFGVSPSDQAHNIFDYPFVSFFKHFYLSFHGAHPLNMSLSTKELLYLIYFMVLLTIALKILLSTFKNVPSHVKPISIVFIALIGLYLFFGDTVMMHYTGYMKASTIFFFVIIFYHAVALMKINLEMLVFLVVGFLMFGHALIERIHPNHISVHEKNITVLEENIAEKAECINDYKYKVDILESKDVLVDNFMNNIVLDLLGKNNTKNLQIILTNESSNIYPITKGFGTVNMSYHWVNKRGEVIQDGIRTKIPKSLLPGESIQLTMIVQTASEKDSKLILSPVQEGCAWFYMVK